MDVFTLTNVASLCSKIAFRNYSPSTAELKQNGGSDSAALAASQIRSQVREIEKKVEDFANEALEADKLRSKEMDLFNLAPKKPNWDLKRDLEKKMDRLEKSTIIAIAQLIRLRLKAEGGIDAGVMDLKAVVDDDE